MISSTLINWSLIIGCTLNFIIYYARLSVQHTRVTTSLTIFMSPRIKLSSYLSASRKKSNLVLLEFEKLDYYIIYKHISRKAITAIKTRNTTTYSCYLDLSENMQHIKTVNNIHERWMVDFEEYRVGLVLLSEQQYRWAVDNLE